MPQSKMRGPAGELILLCGILVSLILFNEGGAHGWRRPTNGKTPAGLFSNGNWKRSDDLNTNRGKRDARNTVVGPGSIIRGPRRGPASHGNCEDRRASRRKQ